VKPSPLVVTAENYPPALNVLGVKITVLASNDATGACEITLQEGDEDVGPPPHRHDWDESFFVVKGTVEMSCEGREVLCAPGTLVHVPAGTLHGYRFAAGGGQMLEISGPGGFATRMFTNVSREKFDGPADVPRLMGVLRDNGVALAT
jgi:quercetin dioxygenase-like cupin family protein